MISNTYKSWLWGKLGETCVKNLKKHGFDAHFAETGVCTDCNSPQRICRITTILHRKPTLSDISVVLVNESLGF